jgi:hypothetical protein
VLYPEEYPLAQQVALFRRAEVIAGYAGSALFTLALSDTPKRVIMISSETYTATNEYMISSVLGHRLDIAWCRPEPEGPGHRFGVRGFTADFNFDFAREGRFLRQVIRD